MASAGFASVAGSAGLAQAAEPLRVHTRARRGWFALVQNGRPAAIVVDPGADPAIADAATRFSADLEQVSGAAPQRLSALLGAQGPAVIVGVIGQCPIVSELAAQGKLDVSLIAGKWEGYVQAVVTNPAPGLAQALVIAGADRRGAVYGLYDLSERIGVSPWYWFADAPVAPQLNLHLAPGAIADWPRVHYRGIGPLSRILANRKLRLSRCRKGRPQALSQMGCVLSMRSICRARGSGAWLFTSRQRSTPMAGMAFASVFLSMMGRCRF